MKKENPTVNILDPKTAEEISSGSKPVVMLYRDKLAERLSVSPKERLTMTLLQNGRVVLVSVLLDGGDLTSSQEVVLRHFLEETGMLTVLASIPERPTTS